MDIFASGFKEELWLACIHEEKLLATWRSHRNTVPLKPEPAQQGWVLRAVGSGHEKANTEGNEGT